MNFDSYHISSTILKLLPNSRKPVETKEINKSKAKGSNQVIDLIKKLSDLYELYFNRRVKKKNYFLKNIIIITAKKSFLTSFYI
jgi:hypothetical protein